MYNKCSVFGSYYHTYKLRNKLSYSRDKIQLVHTHWSGPSYRLIPAKLMRHKRPQSKNTLSAGWVFPSSKMLIEASRKLQCVRQGQPISARCQQRPAPSFGMCWWVGGKHYLSSYRTQEIPLTTPSWFTLILDIHHMCPQLSFPLPQSFQSFCSTFRWWKLKTCGYNFYEKFHFESLLNFNFIAIRKQKKQKTSVIH